jgi:hypothetical protein
MGELQGAAATLRSLRDTFCGRAGLLPRDCDDAVEELVAEGRIVRHVDPATGFETIWAPSAFKARGNGLGRMA